MRTKASLYAILMLAMGLAVLAGCSRKPTPTDAQITIEIQSKLYSDAAIQSRQIEVQAANGVVTLSGEVSNDSERAAAASDAATIEGVKRRKDGGQYPSGAAGRGIAAGARSATGPANDT